jgi:hypothetical protein
MKFFAQEGLGIPPAFRPRLLEGDHIGRIMETLVARRSAFDVVGEFDVSLNVSDDVDWFARAKDKDVPMAIMPEVLLLKRVHDANLTLVATDECHRHLLTALRRSVVRQREHERRGEDEADDAGGSPSD